MKQETEAQPNTASSETKFKLPLRGKIEQLKEIARVYNKDRK